MASSYVNDLRLNEMATGDASGTWGDTTNTNLELIAEAFSYGTEAITTNADTHTTTIADGATDPGRSIFLKYTGTLDSTCTITIGPNTVSKLWIIENGTSGSQSIIIKQGSGATVTIPSGKTKVIYSDGAGSGGAMVDAFASLNLQTSGIIETSSSIQTPLIEFTDGDDAMTIADGGGVTFAQTATFSDDIIIGDGKTIGSASDVDAMTIAANGQITLTQTLIGTALDISGDIDVDGTTNLDVVDIDGAVDMASTLQVDGAITSSAGATITTADNTNQLTLVSTDADSAVGPVLDLYRNSGSPADDDFLGKINFRGRNDNSQDVNYGSLSYFIADASDGTEDAFMQMSLMKGGSGHLLMEATSTETVFNQGSVDQDFRVESNGETHAIFVDAGNNEVGLFTSAPNGLLHIGDSNAEGDTTNPALQIGGTSTYRMGLYTSSEGAVIENKNGDDGLQFRVKTAGEAMRVDGGTGNVFIGATSANTGGFGSVSPQLQVAGSMPQVLLHETDTDKDGYIGISGSTMFIQTADAIPIRFGTSDAQRMIIASNGAVGFGTTPPSDTHTGWNQIFIGQKGSLFSENATGTHGIDGMIITDNLYIDSDTGSFANIETNESSAYKQEGGVHTFHSQASGSAGAAVTLSEKMRVDGSGNVLVGTTTFNNLSTEAGVLASNNVVMARGSLADHQDACAVLQYASDATWLRAYGDTSGSGYMIFRAGGGAGATDVEYMRINSTGEIHITSGGSAISPTIKHGGGTGDVAKLRLINRSGQSSDKGGALELGGITDDGVTRSDVFASIAGLKDNATSGNKAGYMQFMTSNGSSLAEKMRLDSNGKLIVGDTTALNSAGALGSFVFSGGQGVFISTVSQSTGEVMGFVHQKTSVVGTIAINSSSTTYNTSSDARLKEITGDAKGLEIINKLNPVAFNWKVDNKSDEGLIAQEVLDIVPNAVSQRENGYYQMDYSKLVTPLIKAIQEQQEQIDALQSEINLLKGE